MHGLDASFAPSTPDTPRHPGHLLRALEVIDTDGWDGPTGTALLGFVRDDLVRPLVLGAGLRGAAAAQAEATGWEAAWEVLAHPGLRTVASPWGVVWKAVNRAVLGEVLAALYHVSPRRAWALRGAPPGHPGGTSLGVCSLHEPGVEVADPSAGPEGLDRAEVRAAVAAAARVLLRAGWPPQDAEELLTRIVEDPAPASGTSVAKSGWLAVASDLDLPPWQVRRVMVLLFGAPDWAGLLERALRGEDVDTDLALRAAARATRVRSRRSPALEARRAAAAEGVGNLGRAS